MFTFCLSKIVVGLRQKSRHLFLWQTKRTCLIKSYLSVLDGHEEIDLNEIEEPQERPPEPTVPDERVDQSSSDEEESSQPQERPQGQPQGQPQGDFLGDFLGHPQGHPQGQSQLKDETSRKISSLLSELVGDRPAGEAMHRPDLVPMR